MTQYTILDIPDDLQQLACEAFAFLADMRRAGDRSDRLAIARRFMDSHDGDPIAEVAALHVYGFLSAQEYVEQVEALRAEARR